MRLSAMWRQGSDNREDNCLGCLPSLLRSINSELVALERRRSGRSTFRMLQLSQWDDLWNHRECNQFLATCLLQWWKGWNIHERTRGKGAVAFYSEFTVRDRDCMFSGLARWPWLFSNLCGTHLLSLNLGRTACSGIWWLRQLHLCQNAPKGKSCYVSNHLG